MPEEIPFDIAQSHRLKMPRRTYLPGAPQTAEPVDAEIVEMPEPEAPVVRPPSPPPEIGTWALEGASPYSRYAEIRAEEMGKARKEIRSINRATGSTPEGRAWKRTQMEFTQQKAWLQSVHESADAAFDSYVGQGLEPPPELLEAMSPEKRRMAGMPVRTPSGMVSLAEYTQRRAAAQIAQERYGKNLGYLETALKMSRTIPSDYENFDEVARTTGRLGDLKLKQGPITRQPIVMENPLLEPDDPRRRAVFFPNGTRNEPWHEAFPEVKDPKEKKETPQEKAARVRQEKREEKFYETQADLEGAQAEAAALQAELEGMGALSQREQDLAQLGEFDDPRDDIRKDLRKAQREVARLQARVKFYEPEPEGRPLEGPLRYNPAAYDAAEEATGFPTPPPAPGAPPGPTPEAPKPGLLGEPAAEVKTFDPSPFILDQTDFEDLPADDEGRRMWWSRYIMELEQEGLDDDQIDQILRSYDKGLFPSGVFDEAA